MKKSCNIDFFVCDFKKSNEFNGVCSNTTHFAEFEDCYTLIKEFYEIFLATPEGGDEKIKILIIDEIAGMLTHFSMNKEEKKKADEIRQIMSSILMLGRSRQFFLILSLQRFTTSIFPAGSGSIDNFHILCGLGVMNPQARMALFAGEHFEGEEELQYGQAKGIVLIDGQPIQSIAIPKANKAKLLELIKKQP